MTRQFLPPEIDDRYELGDLLGTGGSGAVYKATDRRSGSAVAVKVLHQPLLTEPSRARFEREVAAHARLADVRGVVQVHAHGVAEQRGWIAMDLHELTLAERLMSLGAMTTAEAMPLLRDCATALDAVHRAGVLHRDIKPSNVFLTADGRAVLADLGVVSIEGEPTLTGMTPLSLQWAAPETIESGESSTATDIYGLGATAFAMLNGAPPFDLAAGATTDQAIAVGPALRLIASGNRPKLAPHVVDPLRSLVDDMLAIDPAARPASAADVLERLAPEAEVALIGAKGDRSRTAVALLILPVLLVAALIGWIAVRSISSATTADEQATTAAAIAESTVAPSATTSGDDANTATSPAATNPTPAPSTDDPNAATSPGATAVAAPVTEPTTGPTSAPATTCVSGALWCDSLVLDEWSLQGDPQITSFAQTVTEFGPGFELTAGPGDEGSRWVERSLPGIGDNDTIALRFRVRFDELPSITADDQSFQTLAMISDERGANWTVNMVAFPEGVFFNSGYFVPEDISGGASAAVPHAVETWHCVELVLTEDGTTPVELFVNGESLIALADEPAGTHGVGFSLSLGPRWLEGPEFAPQITLADAHVANTRIDGC